MKTTLSQLGLWVGKLLKRQSTIRIIFLYRYFAIHGSKFFKYNIAILVSFYMTNYVMITQSHIGTYPTVKIC